MNSLIQSMRWFGPNDPVELSYIRQAGAEQVVTALHHIPVGDIWSKEEIVKRIQTVQSAGLAWEVVESLPVHENIKQRKGNYKALIENYKISLQNLAHCGVTIVTYNFMPLFDWIRTDLDYKLANGASALYFNKRAFAAFDLYTLQRPDAKQSYSLEEIEEAEAYYQHRSDEERAILSKSLLLGLPGSSDQFEKEKVLNVLQDYQSVSEQQYRENLISFLKEIIPTAAECGVKMAIHPDDPPYSLFGLPRVVSNAEDFAQLFEAVPDLANGLCFCSGSLGVRTDNDLLKIMEDWKTRIHFIHLRNVQRLPNGDFFEAEHLYGSSDMYALMKKIIQIMQERNIRIPMRPDHGHKMLDDLHKNTYPGYSAIGRLKALAELRGLEMAIGKILQ